MALNGIAALKGIIESTKAYAAAQWLLNIAMDANPIGIVIIALAALAAGLIYVYTQSEEFRSYMSTAWDYVKIGALTMVKWIIQGFQFMANTWLYVVGALLDGAARAFGWVPGIGPMLQGAAKKFGEFKTAANAQLDAIQNSIDVQINTATADAQLEALHREFLSKGWTVTATANVNMVYSGNGQVTPHAAAGGFQRAGVPVLVGENHPEVFIPKTDGYISPHRPSGDMGGSQKSAPTVNIEHYHEGSNSPAQVASELMFRARFA
jgi:hypothetical protein